MDAKDHKEAVDMCLTCGCMRPHDNMGNPDNLVIEDLEKSAAASGVSLDQAVANLVKAADVAKAETEHHQRWAT